MPYGRPWTAEEDALGKKMLSEGRSYREIAGALGRSYVAVYHRNKSRWKAADLKPHWSPEEEAEAKRLLAQGLSYRAISRRMNRSASSIRTKNYRSWHVSNMKARPRTKSASRVAYYSKKAREKRDFSGRRRRCLLRDNLTCQVCGITDPTASILAVHHVDGNGRGRPHPNNEIGNLVTLCWRCHARVHHGRGGSRARVLLNRALDRQRPDDGVREAAYA